jgi:tetrahydromethanopterin S-methyltransferase subunit B
MGEQTVGAGEKYEFGEKTNGERTVTLRGTDSDISSYNSNIKKTLYAGKDSTVTISYNPETGAITDSFFEGDNAGLYKGDSTQTKDLLDGVIQGKAQRASDFLNYVKSGELSLNYESVSSQLNTKVSLVNVEYTNPIKGTQTNSVIEKVSNAYEKIKETIIEPIISSLTENKILETTTPTKETVYCTASFECGTNQICSIGECIDMVIQK